MPALGAAQAQQRRYQQEDGDQQGRRERAFHNPQWAFRFDSCIRGKNESTRKNRTLDLSQVGVAADHRRRLAERRVGVLEAVAGEHADDRLGRLGAASAAGQPVGEDPGDRGGRSRLAEDALARGQQPVGVEDLLVGDRLDPPARAR